MGMTVPFPASLAQVAVELSNLLGVRFVPGNLGMSLPAGRVIARLLQYHNEGDFLARDVELFRLAFFVKHLREVEAHDKKLRKKFAKLIRAAKTESDFAGYRFEVATAASLIRKQLSFTRPDPPDFIVANVTGPITVECGSVYLIKERDRPLHFKIQSVITDKAGKPYASDCAALFIDITNLEHSPKHDSLFAGDGTRELVKDFLKGKPLGTVLLFANYATLEPFAIGSRHARIDNDEISAALKSFLDVHYPSGNVPIHGPYVVPSSG